MIDTLRLERQGKAVVFRYDECEKQAFSKEDFLSLKKEIENLKDRVVRLEKCIFGTS